MKTTIIAGLLLVSVNASSHDSLIDHPHYANSGADAYQQNAKAI